MSGVKFGAVAALVSTWACLAGTSSQAQGFVNGNVGFAQGGFNNGFAGSNGLAVRQFGVGNGFNGTVNSLGGGFGGYPYGGYGYGYATPPMTANTMIPLGGAIQSQIFRRPRRR